MKLTIQQEDELKKIITQDFEYQNIEFAYKIKKISPELKKQVFKDMFTEVILEANAQNKDHVAKSITKEGTIWKFWLQNKQLDENEAPIDELLNTSRKEMSLGRVNKIIEEIKSNAKIPTDVMNICCRYMETDKGMENLTVFFKKTWPKDYDLLTSLFKGLFGDDYDLD